MEIPDWVVLTTLSVETITILILSLVLRFKTASSSATTKSSSSPKSVVTPAPQSPILVPKRFGSTKTIKSSDESSFYYMSDGYLTFKNQKDMSKWNVDKPLNYTHARINNIIFKFNNPNSSDSSGFAVDELGNQFAKEKTPASEFSNVIDFGFFI